MGSDLNPPQADQDLTQWGTNTITPMWIKISLNAERAQSLIADRNFTG